MGIEPTTRRLGASMVLKTREATRLQSPPLRSKGSGWHCCVNFHLSRSGSIKRGEFSAGRSFASRSSDVGRFNSINATMIINECDPVFGPLPQELCANALQLRR